MKTFWLFYICIQSIVLCEITEDVKFIRNFIRNQKEAVSVSAYLCWDEVNIKNLIFDVQKDNVYISIQNPDEQKPQIYESSKIYILDMSCSNFKEILDMGNKKQLFQYFSQWLILFPDALYNATDNKLFQAYDMFFNSRVLITYKSPNQTYEIASVFKYNITSEMRTTKIGEWIPKKNVFSFKSDKFMEVRQNFNRFNLRATFVYISKDSLNHLTDNRDKNIDTQLKINYVYTNHVFDYLNATKTFDYVTSWGEMLPNKTLTGLIGKLYRRELDVTGSPLFCVAERLRIYHCLAMTTPGESYFLFRQPPLSYVANIYALPFRLNLWLTDIAFLMVFSILLYLVVKWEWKIRAENNEAVTMNMIESNFWDSVLFTISAVCQQGYHAEPQSISGKIITLTMFFTLIFIFTAYSASTVVLFQSSASNIKTLNDLYESKLELGVDDKPYFRSWFPLTPGAIKRKVYADRIAPKNQKPNFYPLEEGIEKMRKGYFAFYTDDVTGNIVLSKTFQENEKCGLERIPFLDVKHPWLAMPKSTKFHDSFKIAYRKIQETGIWMREIKKMYTQRPECIIKGSSFRSAGILDLYSVYMLFFMGIGLSLVILLFETCTKKCLAKNIFQRK